MLHYITPAMRGTWIDKSAVSLSGLCLVHCLAGSLLLILASSAGGLFNHWIHAVGLMIAMPLAAVGLWRGWKRHGRGGVLAVGGLGLALMAAGLFVGHGNMIEVVFTVAGVTLLGSAHLFNLRQA
jgi:hypothetical protein